MKGFKKGFLHGLPIGLGYLSVSIGFGLLAVSGGLTIGQAVLISMVNLTSAGQLAGTRVMIAGGPLMEIAATQLVINLRYALMSVALSQKMDEDVRLPARLGFAFFVTDEIFAVSAGQPDTLQKPYLAGLTVLPYIGWALGTLIGAALGAVLPAVLRDGMGILLYGMFLAIIVPPARESASIRAAVVLSAALSCALRYVPELNRIGGGFAVVLCAVAASVFCAWRYPVREGA